MARAAIYTRLSRDRPEERSRADQEADCRALAEAKGYEIVAALTDLESGYRKAAKRPGYVELLAGLRRREYEAVVVWKLDRLTRQGVRAIGPLLDVLEDAGAVLISVHDPIDTSTALGEGILAMLASFARQESENTSLRVSRARRHYAEAGRPRPGGHRPFGHSADWTELVEPEAALIREAAERLLAGGTLSGITASWNAQGVRTTTGREWRRSAVRGLLIQRRLYGAREHRGVVVAKDVFPAIIDALTSARLRAVLQHSRTGPVARSRLLAGLVRCGKCGAKLGSSGQGYSCYAPGDGGCGGVAIRAEALDDAVSAMVIHQIEWIEPAVTAAKDEDLVTQEAKLLELADLWEQGAIGREEWLYLREKVTVSLAAAVEAAAVPAPPVDRLQETARRWDEADFDLKRAAMVQMVESVVVHPIGKGRRVPAAERVDVRWATRP